MSKIIRLTESDLARIVRRVISEQGPKPLANVASTTSVSKLPNTGGPKPVNLIPTATSCLKGYIMDKNQKYYQKQGDNWQDKKLYPSGKWSELVQGQNGNYNRWGTWKCSSDKVIFDMLGTEVGKQIDLDNGDSFTDSQGGAYSVTNQGHQMFSGKIVSKTPDPQSNGYKIKVKGDGYGSSNGSGCVTTSTSYMEPQYKGSFRVMVGFDVEPC